jgi:hypothetical protein
MLEDRTVSRVSVFCLVAGSILVCATVSAIGRPQPARASDQASAEIKVAPVETNMHELMEYVFQPTFKRLKPAMAPTQAAEPAWKAIKSDSLILAESSNLLLLHTAPKEPARWNETSAAVRDASSHLYRAARQRDFAASRKAYEQMLTSCNACHKAFAGGRHMLAP